jgi:hypothetical protein
MDTDSITPTKLERSTVVECTVCSGWSWNRSNATTNENTNDLDKSIHNEDVKPILTDTLKSEPTPIIEPTPTEKQESTTENPVKFDWEANYFKKFDWLDENTERYIIAENLANYIDHLDLQLDDNSDNKPLFLYFVSLENCKMFLYHCEEKTYEEVLVECGNKYEYTQINRPIKVVFVLPNIKYSEIDENVKLFMHQFGIDNTRGGSYTEVELSNETKQTLCEEFAKNMIH